MLGMEETLPRLNVNRRLRKVYVDGTEVKQLSRHQWRMLCLLLDTDGIVTHDDIVAHVYHEPLWSGKCSDQSRKSLVCRLRQRLGRAGVYIRTVTQHGYYLRRAE